MNEPITTIDALRAAAVEHGLHTIEVAVPDTQGHLRGKRVPVQRFLEAGYSNGVNMADAIFVFDMQNDMPENEFLNMETGYLDSHIVPDIGTSRILTHRPGYALVFGDAKDQHGEPHALAPRNILAAQVERCRAAGLNPFVATELEFFLCNPDWTPVQDHIQYSSLTDGTLFEVVLADMRTALLGAGIEVEGSNAEYGAGQFEINTGPSDALTTADNTVLFKSIVKQVAEQHGFRASFMPKPWVDQAGSGMHVHTSLKDADENVFADCTDGEPNETMRRWTGGLLHHAQALTLLGAPTPNGPKRIRPFTFAPTHVTWGLDNRTVMARCIVEGGSQANRVEYRSAGADANPYLLIAGLLAAGLDGLENQRDPGEISTGDNYTNPGDSAAIPTDLGAAISAFVDSELAGLLGDVFSRSYASIAQAEVVLATEHSPDQDAVNEWERSRFIEHC